MTANRRKASGDWDEGEWCAPSKFVCAECVQDEDLRITIFTHRLSEHVCSYCGVGERAAPVSAILEPIGKALHRYFADPGNAGAIRDEGEWLIDTITTEAALKQLPLLCHQDVFSDVARAFHNTAWVPCNGHFLDLHEGEHMTQAWDQFEELTKHRTRYFFVEQTAGLEVHLGQMYLNPADFLRHIAGVVTGLNVLRKLDEQQALFRARHAKKGVTPTIKDMGAPPNKKANAGRMNPAGISYLYLAKELTTAIREVSQEPAQILVAQFRLKREVNVLDLTEVPDPPSVFALNEYDRRQGILFLQSFVTRITMPLKKDGKEHIEYVPSQVVSEYLAQVFSLGTIGQNIDGIVYPSTVASLGQNVVIFPPKKGGKWEDIIELVATESFEIDSGGRLTPTD